MNLWILNPKEQRKRSEYRSLYIFFVHVEYFNVIYAVAAVAVDSTDDAVRRGATGPEGVGVSAGVGGCLVPSSSSLDGSRGAPDVGGSGF